MRVCACRMLALSKTIFHIACIAKKGLMIALRWSAGRPAQHQSSIGWARRQRLPKCHDETLLGDERRRLAALDQRSSSSGSACDTSLTSVRSRYWMYTMYCAVFTGRH